MRSLRQGVRRRTRAGWTWTMLALLALGAPAAARAQSITLSATAFAFTSTPAVPTPASQSLVLQNGGTGKVEGLTLGNIVYEQRMLTGWLIRSAVASTLHPDEPQTVKLGVDPGSLAPGTYTASFTVAAIEVPAQTVTVTMVIADPAGVLEAMTSTSVTFTSTDGEMPPTQTVIVRNGAPPGGEVLRNFTIGAVTYGPGASNWLNRETQYEVTNTSQGTITLLERTPDQRVRFRFFADPGGWANPAGLPNGTYTASFTVTARTLDGVTHAPGSPMTITVTLVVARPEAVLEAMTPTAVTLTTTDGTMPPSQTVTVRNGAPAGGRALKDVRVSAIAYGPGASNWLTRETITADATFSSEALTLGSKTPDQRIRFRLLADPAGWANPAGLPNGTYTASFTVTARTDDGVTHAPGSPMTITVALVVARPQAVLEATTPTAVTFTWLGGSRPTSQWVEVRNGAPPGGRDLKNVVVGPVTYGAGAPGWLARTTVWTETVGRTDAITIGTRTPDQRVRFQLFPFPPDFDTDDLPDGTYTTSFVVTGRLEDGTTHAPGSPMPITVTLVVDRTPLIVATPASPSTPVTPPPGTPADAALIATSRAGGPNPPPTFVSVTNGRPGTTLTGLVVQGVDYAAGQPGGWLSAALNYPEAPASLSLNATVGALPPGDYRADVTLASPTTGASPVVVPVVWTITAPPLIALSTTETIAVQTAQGSNPSATTLMVTNGGTGVLDQVTLGAPTYGAGQPTGWLAVAASGSTAPLAVVLQYVAAGLPAGVYDASVPVASPVAGNGPLAIVVRLTVLPPPPMIALDKPALLFTVATGGNVSPQQVVKIANAGTGTLGQLALGSLAYAPGGPQNWLIATLSATTAPATLALRANGRVFTTAGSWTLEVPIVSPQGVNSPKLLAVTVEAWRLADCSAALTTPSRLTEAQRARLDQLGNRNGVYDTPDYLALLQRAGLAPMPAGTTTAP